MFTTAFSKRDFSARQTIPGLRVTVESFTFNVFGGCSEATLRVEGDEQALLYGLLNYLRAPVEVFDERGECRWWGMVHSVVIHPPGVGLTLDGMANRVRVAYSTLALGDVTSTRGTTDWAEDTDSESNYGTREITETLNDATATLANQRRDVALRQRKTPLPVIEMGSDAPGAKYANINCRGWVDTLDWRMYSRALLQASYDNLAATMATQRVGPSDDAPINGVNFIMQKITLPFSVTIDNVSLVLGNWGDPQQLVVSLRNPADLTAIYTQSVAQNWPIAGAYTISGIPLASSYYLAAGAQTWFVVTGAQLYGNAWLVGIREEAGGTLYYAQGDIVQIRLRSSAGLPAANLIYRLTGTLDTGTLSGDAISSHAEFITAVDLQTSSGVRLSAYRDGESSLSRVIQEMLDAGTSNNRRLLLTITRDRVAQITEEPLGSIASPDLLMTMDGKIYDARKRPIGARSPVGKWVKIIDTPLSDSLSNPPHFFFVERATYTVADDRWEIEPRGSDSPFIARVA
jgi:hypothetical protein